MFEKSRIKRLIKNCKRQITLIEKRRTRSQAAIIEAILTNTVADDKDVDYFNHFTTQIDQIRDRMHEYQKQLDRLK